MSGASNRLPAKVKVGYTDYAIEVLPAREGANINRYGDCSHVLGRIRIDMQHGTRSAAHTLLHEIMHAVCACWERLDDDREEPTVAKMSLGLAAVWRDNPDVLEWIGHHLIHDGEGEA